MSMQWEEVAQKMLPLLKISRESRQQQILLLESLLDSIIADGAQELFRPLFEGFEADNLLFGFQQELIDELNWREGRAIKEEYDFFWPWCDLYFKLFPQKLAELPENWTVKGLQKWPSFMNQENSCEKLWCSQLSQKTIIDPNSGEEVEIADMDWSGVEHSTIKELGLGDAKNIYDYPFTTFLKRKGLIIIESRWPSMKVVFDNINGQQRLVACLGFENWIPTEERSISKHPNLQVVTKLPVSNLVTHPEILKVIEQNHHSMWNSTTENNFIDWNYCRIHLNPDSSLPIKDRATCIQVYYEYWTGATNWSSWDANNHADIWQIIFGDNEFPNLENIRIVAPPETSFIFPKSFTVQFPSLRMLYIEGETENIEFPNDFFVTEHPLEIIYQRGNRIQFIGFDKSKPGNLAAQATQMSMDAQWFCSHAQYFSNVRQLNLNQITMDIGSFLSKLPLTNFVVERDASDKPLEKNLWAEFDEPLLLKNWKDKLQWYPEQLNEKYDLLDSPDRPPDPDVWEMREKGLPYSFIVKNFDDLMECWKTIPADPFRGEYCPFKDEMEDFHRYRRCRSDFIKEFIAMAKSNTLPEDFINWFKEREKIRNYYRTAIKVGSWYFWLDGNGNPQLSSNYSCVGMTRIQGSWYPFDTQKILVGYPKLPDDLKEKITHLCLQAKPYEVRHNDAAFPFDILLTMSKQEGGFSSLVLNVPEVLDLVPQLTSVDTLSITDQNLTQLPKNIGDLKKLSELYLWKNQLSSLPESFSQLTNLRKINLSWNKFTSLPEVLFQLPNLEEICFNPISKQPNFEEELMKTASKHPAFCEALQSKRVKIF